jgi:hypothetical protein
MATWGLTWAVTAALGRPEAAGDPAPRPAVIDFTRDGAGGELGDEHTGPPPDIAHPSLLNDKYRGVASEAPDDPIADPLAVRAAPTRERATWLGVRIAAGMFDDSVATARAGVAVGLAGRRHVAGGVFVAARADWSRRGGEVMAANVDVVGASAGLGATLARSASAGLALALIGQLRGDLRLTAQRDGAAVRRAGLGVAAAAELALLATPITVGLRYEQGMTVLVAGGRDRAVLVELGVDLR